MTNSEPLDLLSTAQVAKLAKVVPHTVNRWAKSGRLPVAMKLPGRTGLNLYRRADVEALLAEDAERSVSA